MENIAAETIFQHQLRAYRPGILNETSGRAAWWGYMPLGQAYFKIFLGTAAGFPSSCERSTLEVFSVVEIPSFTFTISPSWLGIIGCMRTNGKVDKENAAKIPLPS